VSSEDEVKAMYAAMFRAFGTIDILCVNAGIQNDSPFVEMSLAKWNHVLSINLTGQFLCARGRRRENSSSAECAPKCLSRGKNHLHEFGASGNSMVRARELRVEQGRHPDGDADDGAGTCAA
jgi:NAD(P)-dependent dehydrogenase (short-subunit alcohol dehydrogenase family)